MLDPSGDYRDMHNSGSLLVIAGIVWGSALAGGVGPDRHADRIQKY